MIYEDFLGFKKPDALTDNLEAEGFETTYFIFNVGSMIVPIALLPVQMVLYYFLKWFNCLGIKCLQRMEKKLKK